jgi:predicted Zn-dependent protease with MMP-like domain
MIVSLAMSEQGFIEPGEDDNPSEDEYDYAREPEPDEYTLRSNEQRSRYFLAAISFLLALLCLSAWLNHIPWLNDTLLQLGILGFAAIGIFFLLRGSPTNRVGTRSIGEQTGERPGDDDVEQASSLRLYESGYREDGYWSEPTLDDVDGHDGDNELTPFEVLVQEALATIPQEFQERMENVLVRVEYEPGEEVLRRVGTREGYTLLGLYEGVPLTVYGRQHSSLPETITIYQRTIERYCHGDPNRIREQVRKTVLHEVAHHFGIDHDEMPIWIK